jgi:hypothetical protein
LRNTAGRVADLWKQSSNALKNRKKTRNRLQKCLTLQAIDAILSPVQRVKLHAAELFRMKTLCPGKGAGRKKHEERNI